MEPLQLMLGLSIPALIIAHLTGVRLSQALFGQEKFYPQLFYTYWVVFPYRIWQMFAALLVAWIHGCIGLYFWLRMRAFYRRAAPFLLAAAVLVPTLAMLGLYQGGRSIVAASANAEWRAGNLGPGHVGTPEQQVVLEDIADYSLLGYFGLLGLVLLARSANAGAA
jgi:adenylate cyclase